MSLREEALKLHKDNQGKIEVISKVKVNDAKDLSLAYTQGLLNHVKKSMLIQNWYMIILIKEIW